jgi:hypothetical protein
MESDYSLISVEKNVLLKAYNNYNKINLRLEFLDYTNAYLSPR